MIHVALLLILIVDLFMGDETAVSSSKSDMSIVPGSDHDESDVLTHLLKEEHCFTIDETFAQRQWGLRLTAANKKTILPKRRVVLGVKQARIP